MDTFLWLTDEQMKRVGLLMQQFDIGIVDWKVLPQKKQFKVYRHNKEKEKLEFDIREESVGTQVLLDILSRIVIALDRGSILIIDEMDRSLHPLLLIESVRLFKSKAYNPKGAQLIFTTHTTDILDAANLLQATEVGIVSKSLPFGTRVRRCTEDADVQNLRTSYLQGELRGIPYPYL